MTDPAAAARAAAGECAHAYHDAFAERFVAAYLLGSLAHGGYAPNLSDIDLAIVLTDTRDNDPGTIETISTTLRRQGGLHRKLSTFWASLPALCAGHDDGRFPALDRLDLAEHGVLLLGNHVAPHIARPTTDELLLDSAWFAINVLATDQVITEFHYPNRLLTDPVWFTKTVLFPPRFLYTTVIGRAAANTEAIAWYLNQPQPTAALLVRLAAHVRTGHPLNPTQIRPQLAKGLIPLYQHYLNDYMPRLRRANAPADLLLAFTHWREDLTATT